MEELRKTIISGGRWMLLQQAVGQPVRIIVSILLTRIIAPADFGIVAKAFAITGVVELIFVNSLFGSIVQSKTIDNKQLNSLFVLSVITSFLVSTLLYLVSGQIANFYEDERVVWVVKIASLSIFISGIRLVSNALLNRNLKYKELSLINIIATIVSSAFALILAYKGYGYKALIYQVLALNLIITVSTVVTSKWLPGLKLNISGLREHLTFGSHVIVNNLLSYAVRNTDNIAIGKFRSDIELGYYSRAYFLMMMPISQVGQIFSSTLFPAFSKIKEDKERILSILNQAQEIIIILIFPVLIWFFVNIEFLIDNVLGEEWVASSIYFKIFIPLMLVQLVTIHINNVYMALNKVGYLLKISVLTKPFLVALIVIAATKSAVYVAAVIMLISTAFSLYTYIKGLSFLSHNAIKKQLKFLYKTLTSIFIFGLFLGGTYFLLPSGILLSIVTFTLLIFFYISVLRMRSEVKRQILEFFKLDRY